MRHYSVEGYEGYADSPDAGRHDYIPAFLNIEDVYGFFVHVWDDEDPTAHTYFWTWGIGGFIDWDEWWDYIDLMMDISGAIT